MKLIYYVIIIFSLVITEFNSSSAQTNFWTTTSVQPFGMGEKFAADSAGNLYTAGISSFRKRVFKSTNAGTTWKVVYELPFEYESQDFNSLSVLPEGRIFIGMDSSGFLYSSNAGANWSFTGTQNGLISSQKNYGVTKIQDGSLLALSSYKLFKSTNGGANWFETGAGISVNNGGNIFVSQSGALLYASGSAMFRSTDNGANWSIIIIPNVSVYKITGGSGNSFILFGKSSPSARGNIYYTTDAGAFWQQSNLSSLNTPNSSYSFNGTNHFIYLNDSLFKSSNGGTSFQFLPGSILYPDHIKGDRSGNMFAYFDYNYSGIYRTTNNGFSWDYTENGVSVGFSVDKLLFDKNGLLYAFGNAEGGGRVYISSNQGEVWRRVYPDEFYYASYADSSSVYALTYTTTGGQSYLKKTTDGGYNWGILNDKMPFINLNVLDMAVKGQILLAGTLSGLYRSTNGGSTWVVLNNGIPQDVNAHRLFKTAQGSFILSGSSGANTSSVIYVSGNNGSSWTSVLTLPANGKINGFTEHQSVIYCYSKSAGIYKSINDGLVWTKLATDLPDGVEVTSMAINSLGQIFTSVIPTTVNGNYYGGVYKSINSGTNFYQVNSGIADAYVNSLALDNSGVLFGGTKYFGVVKTTSSTSVGITQSSSQVPDKFELKQNYPNPFNPATVISYRLSANSLVNLSVYDITGRHISTLVDSKQSAGTYDIDFNGSNLSSGVYIYMLTIGDIKLSKRMVLVK